MKCPDCGAENLPGDEECGACRAPLASLALPQAKGANKKILEGTIAQLKPQLAISIPHTLTVAETIKLMRERKMGCVLVNNGGKLAGIFTERDVLMKIAGLKDPAKVKIADVMKGDPQCLTDEDSISFAFHNMAVNNYRHIPIKRKDGSLGIISSRDLLRFLCQ